MEVPIVIVLKSRIVTKLQEKLIHIYSESLSEQVREHKNVEAVSDEKECFNKQNRVCKKIWHSDTGTPCFLYLYNTFEITKSCVWNPLYNPCLSFNNGIQDFTTGIDLNQTLPTVVTFGSQRWSGGFRKPTKFCRAHSKYHSAGGPRGSPHLPRRTAGSLQ
ncbi:unnamed protein product, partial [Nesidiocoris tenuis]